MCKLCAQAQGPSQQRTTINHDNVSDMSGMTVASRHTSRVCMPASCTATAPSKSLLKRLDSCVLASSLSDKLHKTIIRLWYGLARGQLQSAAQQVLQNDMLLEGCLLLRSSCGLKVSSLHGFLQLTLILQLTLQNLCKS